MLPLATTDDVSDLWRPLTSSEFDRVSRLIDKASALLRQRIPWIDDRVSRFNADPTDPAGLDPVTVATVTATIVKRYLVNQDGATNTSVSTGPYTISKGFALRGDKDIRGELVVTESDVAALTPAKRSKSRIGTIKTRPRMAPFPYGDLGNPALGGKYGGIDALLIEEGMSDPSYEFGPFIDRSADE